MELKILRNLNKIPTTSYKMPIRIISLLIVIHVMYILYWLIPLFLLGLISLIKFKYSIGIVILAYTLLFLIRLWKIKSKFYKRLREPNTSINDALMVLDKKTNPFHKTFFLRKLMKLYGNESLFDFVNEHHYSLSKNFDYPKKLKKI